MRTEEERRDRDRLMELRAVQADTWRILCRVENHTVRDVLVRMWEQYIEAVDDILAEMYCDEDGLFTEVFDP